MIAELILSTFAFENFLKKIVEMFKKIFNEEKKGCSYKTTMNAGKSENSHFSFTFFLYFWNICLEFYIKYDYFANDKM